MKEQKVDLKKVSIAVALDLEKNEPVMQEFNVGDVFDATQIKTMEDSLFKAYICFIEPGLMVWYYPQDLEGVRSKLWQWDFDNETFVAVDSPMIQAMLEGKCREMLEEKGVAYDN